MIKDASADDVKMAITNGKVLLDVWKDGCMPCLRMNPTIEKLDSELSDVLFVKMKADDNVEYAVSELKVRSAPTFILFDNGVELKRTSGYISEVEMRNFIQGD
jgi:thioredoxin 1